MVKQALISLKKSLVVTGSQGQVVSGASFLMDCSSEAGFTLKREIQLSILNTIMVVGVAKTTESSPLHLGWSQSAIVPSLKVWMSSCSLNLI